MSDAIVSRVVDMISEGVPFFKDSDGVIWKHDVQQRKIYMWETFDNSWHEWTAWGNCTLFMDATPTTDPSIKLIKKWRFALQSPTMQTVFHYTQKEAAQHFGPNCIALPWTEIEEPDIDYVPF